RLFGELTEADAGSRIQPHLKRGFIAYRDTENSLADIIGCQSSAGLLRVFDGSKASVRALPQDFAAPAQRATDEVRREAIDDVPRHQQAPGMGQIERMPLTPLDVASAFVPVVQFVGCAKPQPDRIVEVDLGHLPRERRTSENAVGRKRIEAIGKNLT